MTFPIRLQMFAIPEGYNNSVRCYNIKGNRESTAKCVIFVVCVCAWGGGSYDVCQVFIMPYLWR